MKSLSLKRAIPPIDIRKKYFLLLAIAFFFSTITHEIGHAFYVLIMGGRVTSFSITRVTWESTSSDLGILLAGPAVNFLLCYVAVYFFFNDSKRRDMWFATILCNLNPPISLILFLLSLPHDETRIIQLLGISPYMFYVLYFIIFLPPILIIINALSLASKKKISFYLYSLVLLLAELKFLNILTDYFNLRITF